MTSSTRQVNCSFSGAVRQLRTSELNIMTWRIRAPTRLPAPYRQGVVRRPRFLLSAASPQDARFGSLVIHALSVLLLGCHLVSPHLPRHLSHALRDIAYNKHFCCPSRVREPMAKVPIAPIFIFFSSRRSLAQPGRQKCSGGPGERTAGKRSSWRKDRREAAFQRGVFDSRVERMHDTMFSFCDEFLKGAENCLALNRSPRGSPTGLLAVGNWGDWLWAARVLAEGRQRISSCYGVGDAFFPKGLQGNDTDDLCSDVLTNMITDRAVVRSPRTSSSATRCYCGQSGSRCCR